MGITCLRQAFDLATSWQQHTRVAESHCSTWVWAWESSESLTSPATEGQYMWRRMPRAGKMKQIHNIHINNKNYRFVLFGSKYFQMT